VKLQDQVQQWMLILWCLAGVQASGVSRMPILNKEGTGISAPKTEWGTRMRNATGWRCALGVEVPGQYWKRVYSQVQQRPRDSDEASSKPRMKAPQQTTLKIGMERTIRKGWRWVTVQLTQVTGSKLTVGTLSQVPGAKFKTWHTCMPWQGKKIKLTNTL